MFRFAVRFLALAAMVLAGIVFGGLGSVVNAQQATPTPPITVNEIAPGVTAEVLAAAPSILADGQGVYVARFIFQPGAEIFPHDHPGTTVLGVLSGSFGWTLVEGTAHVVRGAGSRAAATEDLTVPGTEVILEPGDAIYYEADVVHTARGAGDTEAVVLASLVLETGAALAMPADMETGTPAP